ncbi:MAG TPA: hypothetical protein VG328_06485 [Stellaceae bacterium]|jgi:hypothetical protein|nr:hypothetical protein [Stellaceae bacterium]
MLNETVIRFVTQRRSPPDGQRTGIFREAYRLWRADTLPAEERAELRALLDWFDVYLERPRRLRASPSEHAGKTPLSWIRISAAHHIARFRRLAEIVNEASIPVDELLTERPGYVVYRDAYQVVALPFADTPQ